MIHRLRISISTSRLAVSLLLLAAGSMTTQAQSKMFRLEKDSVPLFRGF